MRFDIFNKSRPLGERWKSSSEDRRVLPVAVLDFVTFHLFCDRRLDWLLETYLEEALQ